MEEGTDDEFPSSNAYPSVNDFADVQGLREALERIQIEPPAVTSGAPAIGLTSIEKDKLCNSQTTSKTGSENDRKPAASLDVSKSSPPRQAARSSAAEAERGGEHYDEKELEDELKRLLALRSYRVLDADCEDNFDRLTAEACNHFQVPIARISLVDLGREFFFACTGCDFFEGGARESPRNCSSFCSHAIGHKGGILVVVDADKDDRFSNRANVERAARFYAGAPLMSPEGMKIGVFCILSPVPRTTMSTDDMLKLQHFAQKTMEMFVQRLERLRLSHRHVVDETQEPLHKHAAVATNLGGHLFRAGKCIIAMKLYQESVQTAMMVEQGNGGVGGVNMDMPPPQRREEMAHILTLLSSEVHTQDSRAALLQKVACMFPDVPQQPPATSAPQSNTMSAQCRNCNLDGLPGLFGPTSKIRRPVDQCHFAPLVFSESFNIGIEEDTPDTLQFMIPLKQSSKATLFNMGLIHYHWGNPTTAFQFFDLAASFSRELHPLAFDPIILGSLNNMAQIHLQYGRPGEAKELLQDALARGNAALTAMYDDHDDRRGGGFGNVHDVRRSRRLRRKLARTVVNMGHVHYYQCDFVQAEATCIDALKLLHSNMDDMEVAAIRYNKALLRHHQGDAAGALAQLDQFIDQTRKNAVGHMELQLAEGLYLKGRILVEKGNLYDSMKPLNEALRIRMGNSRCKPVVLAAQADTLTLVGKVLLDREEYDYALSALNASLAIHRSLSAKQNEELSFEGAQTLMEIGRGLHLNGRLEESLQAYREVIGVTGTYFGQRHPFVARLDSVIGNLLLEAGKVDEACISFSNATRIHVENGLPPNMAMVPDPLHRVELNFARMAGMA